MAWKEAQITSIFTIYLPLQHFLIVVQLILEYLTEIEIPYLLSLSSPTSLHLFIHLNIQVLLRCSSIVLDCCKLFSYVRLKSESLQLTLVNLIFISQKLTSAIHPLYIVLQVFEESIIFPGHFFLCPKHLGFLNPLLI